MRAVCKSLLLFILLQTASKSLADDSLPGWNLNPNFKETAFGDDCLQGLCPVVEIKVRHRGTGTNGLQAKGCSKAVNIPKDLYDPISAIMRSMAPGSGGNIPPSLTSAQQTILLMYATFLQQTTDFDCPL